MFLFMVLAFAVAEPRFTMTPQQGDGYTAELFTFRGGDSHAHARELLPGTQARMRQTLTTGGATVWMLSADDGRSVLYARADHGGEARNFCRLTPAGGAAGSSTARRPLHWCMSYLGGQTPMIEPRPPAPPATTVSRSLSR